MSNQNQSLLDHINASIQDGMVEIPVFSKISSRILSLAQKDDFDMKQLERLIHADPVLTTEVLRSANSAFFRGLTEIKSVRAAVVRLGIKQVTSIVLLSAERSKYSLKTPQLNAMVKKLWMHTVGCALGSQWLAKKLKYPDLETTAFIGGLLHDIGKLLLLRIMDQLLVNKAIPFTITSEFCQEVIDLLHADKGADLLHHWNVPENYCKIVRQHHMNEFDASDIPLTIVRLANKTCNKLGIGLNPAPETVLASTREAQILNTKDVLLAEFEIMLEDTTKVAK